MYAYQLFQLLRVNYELIEGSSPNINSLGKIVEAFPYLTISPIIGQPGCEPISEVHLQLNAKSASFQSYLGNGTFTLISLTVLLAVYNTLSLISFIPPVNPDHNTTIPTSSTGPHIADIRL